MKAKIVYILGAGRSGSTLLERLLSSAPGVVGLGEVHCLWRVPLEKLTCSCGAPARACTFWRDVRAEARLTDGALGRLHSLEKSTIRHKRLIASRGRLDAFTFGPDAQEFLERQRQLFDAVRTVTGATQIIDSSKAAPRAWALSALPDVRIAHLRRRPADVVAAWRRVKHDPALGGPMPRPSALAAAADWLLTELSTAQLSRRRAVDRIAFEEFVAAPEAAIGRLGLDPEAVAWTGPGRFLPDPAYHALNGNPDRFRRGEIAIAPPPRPRLSFRDRTAAAAFGAALERVSP